jgi:hypothetical protein
MTMVVSKPHTYPRRRQLSRCNRRQGSDKCASSGGGGGIHTRTPLLHWRGRGTSRLRPGASTTSDRSTVLGGRAVPRARLKVMPQSHAYGIAPCEDPPQRRVREVITNVGQRCHRRQESKRPTTPRTICGFCSAHSPHRWPTRTTAFWYLPKHFCTQPDCKVGVSRGEMHVSALSDSVPPHTHIHTPPTPLNSGCTHTHTHTYAHVRTPGST